MKYQLICFAFLWWPCFLSCFAQQGFDVVNNLNLSELRRNKVLIDQDTIITLSWSKAIDGTKDDILAFAKFDTFGNLISKKHLSDPENKYVHHIVLNSGIVRKSDRTGYIIPWALFSKPYFIELDLNGNIRYYKEIFASIFPVQLLTVGNDYWVLGSGTRWWDGLPVIGLLKINHNGTQSTLMEYGGAAGYYQSLTGATKVDDNTIVLSSHLETVMGGLGSYARIIAIDSTGKLKWQWQGLPDEELFPTNVQSTADGGWIYGASLLKPAGVMLNFQALIVKRNKDFDLVWRKVIDANASNSLGPIQIEPTPDGNWITCGSWKFFSDDHPGFDNSATFYKFSEMGDSIWSKTFVPSFRYAFPLSNSGIATYIRQMHQLLGGSIVAIGDFDEGNDDLNYRSAQIWLLKISKDGCIDTLLCGPRVSTSSALSVPRPRIKAYPNPANEQVRLSPEGSAGDDWPPGAVLEFFDARGTFVEQRRPGGATEAWDTSNLPSGLYFYRLLSGGKPVFSGKIIVKH